MIGHRVLTEERAAEIVEALEHVEWQPGHRANNSEGVKTNEELRPDAPEPIVAELLAEIEATIREHTLWSQHIVEQMTTPRFNRYAGGGQYAVHTDAAFMGRHVRTDLALTLFLSAPDDYDGGELTVGPTSVKGSAGMAIVYDCWRPHSVAPVTRGARIAVVAWLQSVVPSAEHRELLNMIHSVAMAQTDQAHFAKLGAVHEKLVKLWAR